jgi:4-amino-4-deoxy-L-arabinose transferase-like glycosyltransferase
MSRTLYSTVHKSPLFDPDVFVPFGFSVICNQDLSPGTMLLFWPLTHFFGEVFTYNFLILASFPLTAFGAYLLARELWSNRLAAVLAGIITSKGCGESDSGKRNHR